MWLKVAEAVVTLCEVYAATGVVFAILFLPRGILRVDARLRGSPSAVRLLILPGVAAFWPLFAWRGVTHAPEPIERHAHRIDASRS
jgi:hypothetical protein